MTPKRIRRQRTKGWRMPEGTIYVGRPTFFGNHWRVDSDLGRGLLWDAQTVVDLYRIDWKYRLDHYDPDARRANEAMLGSLRGRDLACWCPLDQPCHADVLIELANAA